MSKSHEMVQVTDWLRLRDSVHTAHGSVPSDEWLRSEGRRLAATGRRNVIRQREDGLLLALFAEPAGGAANA
jgi:hypothetical protein